VRQKIQVVGVKLPHSGIPSPSVSSEPEGPDSILMLDGYVINDTPRSSFVREDSAGSAENQRCHGTRGKMYARAAELAASGIHIRIPNNGVPEVIHPDGSSEPLRDDTGDTEDERQIEEDLLNNGTQRATRHSPLDPEGEEHDTIDDEDSDEMVVVYDPTTGQPIFNTNEAMRDLPHVIVVKPMAREGTEHVLDSES
jgi:hypothetical protein